MEYVRGKFTQSLPVVVFFLAMFYAVLLLFGTQYVMVVSLGTLYFQVNYKKFHTVSSILLLLGQQICLLVLAYAATWNIPFCLLLNLVVPFWLIFSKSSPFNLLGYFSCLMTFTFLQLMPNKNRNFDTMGIKVAVLSFCLKALISRAFWLLRYLLLPSRTIAHRQSRP